MEEIQRQGQFVISAGQIKEYREPRLMTKFDHRVNLPAIFSQNRLAILPISRGDYVISSFEAYRQFEAPEVKIQRVSIPAHLQSLSPPFLVSEAIALNCAAACGVLTDFLEEETLVPTVNGRMGSGGFGFFINTQNGKRYVRVNQAQLEIDAAYEGAGCLALLEAKRDLADDFLIRQLYYPFRLWNSRVTKTVKPVFMVFTNGVFYFYQYAFEDPEDYNSLRLVKQKNYGIATGVSLADLESLLNAARVETEPSVPFPQANSMPRLINLMELLAGRPMEKADITAEYAFDKRQTNYYTDAGRYLGLLEKARGPGGILFQLTPLGKKLMTMGYRERQLALVAAILKHKAFWEVLRLRLQYGEMPSTGAIVAVMREAGLYRVEAGSTFTRRASTIAGWVEWMISLTQR